MWVGWGGVLRKMHESAQVSQEMNEERLDGEIQLYLMNTKPPPVPPPKGKLQPGDSGNSHVRKSPPGTRTQGTLIPPLGSPAADWQKVCVGEGGDFWEEGASLPEIHLWSCRRLNPGNGLSTGA